jgi:hypothetical protein
LRPATLYPNGADAMNSTSILWPVFAMVALTFGVMFRMGWTRLGTMKRERIHPQKVATSAQMSAAIADSRASDNFRNLFELPVLFYAAMLLALATDRTGVLIQVLAWGFVLTRVIHSIIHCGYNTVRHRFLAFIAGALLLIVLWVALALSLV